MAVLVRIDTVSPLIACRGAGVSLGSALAINFMSLHPGTRCRDRQGRTIL